jgi:hypothetical protein
MENHPGDLRLSVIGGLPVEGALLFVLAVYVVVAASWSPSAQHSGEFSAPGFVGTLVAIPE